MPDDLNDLIRRHRGSWQEMERLLHRVEGDLEGDLAGLSETEVRRFGELYREVSRHLIVARARFASPETEEYLNDLVARGYAVIYRGRRGRLGAIWRFYAREGPALVQRRWRSVVAALGVLLAGAAFGFATGLSDPESVRFIVPAEYADMPIEDYLQRKGTFLGAGQVSGMMGMITVNNLRVAAMAFAAGLTFGVGTTLILLYNGLFLASFVSIYVRGGSGLELAGLLAGHGLIEFTAIILSGAAGFVLARGLLFPGERTRALALREEGRTALKLFLLCVPVFLAAMAVESTVSVMHFLPAGFKIAVGFLLLAMTLAWLFLPRPDTGQKSLALLSSETK